MNSKVGGGAALALAMALAACSGGGGAGARLAQTGSGYCAAFKAPAGGSGASLAAAASDPAAAVEDCVHRWGYALAPDAESADIVAQAVMNACSPVLSAWSRQISGGAPASPPPDQAGGQGAASSNPALAQRMGMAEGRALFYVVQARAAGCAPPPSNTLNSASGLGAS